MKKVLFLIALITCYVSVKAQESAIEQAKKDYLTATQEERERLDSLYKPLEGFWEKEQVKTIGGVPFGITHEKAEEMLENKFGRAEYNPYSTVLTYKSVKYAGHDFDFINFLFQSDGVKSYLNSCVFVINAKSLEDAIEKEKYVAENLLSKYKLFEDKDSQGNPIHIGGISPLWDGHWYTLDFLKHGFGVHSDIIKFDNDFANTTDVPYAVRIIYGPYNYVQEEF